MQSGPMAVSPLRVFVKTLCIQEYAIIYPLVIIRLHQHKYHIPVSASYRKLERSYQKTSATICIVWCIFPSPVKLSSISRYTFPPQPEGYNVSGPESRNQDQSQSHNLKHGKIQETKKAVCWGWLLVAMNQT